MTNIHFFQMILSAFGVAFIALAFAACIEWKYKLARKFIAKKIKEYRAQRDKKFKDKEK